MATKAKRMSARARHRRRMARRRRTAREAMIARAFQEQNVEGVYIGAPPGSRKLSEVILELAEPLWDEVPFEAREMALQVAMLAWNLANMPVGLRRRAQIDIVCDASPFDRVLGRPLGEAIHELMERKARLFPDDQRLVLNYSWTCERDEGYLEVMSSMDPAGLPA